MSFKRLALPFGVFHIDYHIKRLIDVSHLALNGFDPVQEVSDSLRQPGAVDLAFLNDQHAPSQPIQSSANPLVARGVALEFSNPIAASRRGYSAAAAVVQMPEAAVDDDDFSMPGEHEIGRARERRIVQAIAEAQGMRESPDHQLRRRVPRLDRRHDPAMVG